MNTNMSSKETSSGSTPTQKGVRLTQVELHRDDTNTDIDIIAIHGLDTTSRDTWTWRDSKDLKNEAKWVNWLHPGMLPDQVARVRIFTCDWPADLHQPRDMVPKALDECSRSLLEGIHVELYKDNARRDRPIVFIASCFGGIILARALVLADFKDSNYHQFRIAVRGIVFLSTPFRGTSFQDIAAWAEPGLRVRAFLKGKALSKLLGSVKGPTFDLQELVRSFTRLCQDEEHPCNVFTFSEQKVTSLPHKAFPWLPPLFRQNKPLVGDFEGTLDIVREPTSLDRSHLLMNKFHSPECPDYKKVAGKISEIVEKIRVGSPLERADAWIRDKHYTGNRLKIERLSGELLLMDRCYINLSIVEMSEQEAGRPKEEKASPFSMWSRRWVSTSSETTQVELATLFDLRKGREGQPIKPRKILIRGRAGVGKTTLCKKIIFEFTQGTWAGWSKLFDRILWVPLRNLKLDERRRSPKYNLEDLFNHEYFSLPKDMPELAKALYEAVETKSDRTLFLLDGLDEVSQDLTGDAAMSRFLNTLLKQPNVIITSRPSGTLPADIPIDLELETMGFYPDQVKDYIERAFSDSTGNIDCQKTNEVQSFIKGHWLIGGLVQVPIQLDALCYTWDDLDQGTAPDTMTGMYKAIELNLWKKDAVRMSKKHNEEFVTSSQIGSSDVEAIVEHEICFLENLAFNGLVNELIEFSEQYLKSMPKMSRETILLRKTLPCLSFLRTSDARNRSYHFIHLTFQEYFAARYFVRQWRTGKSLEYLSLDSQTHVDTYPVKFLQTHKYTAQYEIMWRFVTGLLDATSHEKQFLDMLDQEPLDLLGPAHQRLVMQCLSEVSRNSTSRPGLEQRLAKWFLFESKVYKNERLAREVEAPDAALVAALSHALDEEKVVLLGAIKSRQTITPNLAKQVACLLNNGNYELQKAAAAVLEVQAKTVATVRENADLGVQQAADNAAEFIPNNLSRKENLEALAANINNADAGVRSAAFRALGDQASLPERMLEAVAAKLEDADADVREVVIQVLGEQASLPERMLEAVAAKLKDANAHVLYAAVMALEKQASLSERMLEAVAAKLEDEDAYVRRGAVRTLGNQASLPERMLEAVAAKLKDADVYVQQSAVKTLGKQASLPKRMLEAVATKLEGAEAYVRSAAIRALGEQTSLPEKMLEAVAAKLEDADAYVQRVAILALGKQASLPERMLEAMATFLEDDSGVTRREAEGALRRHESFYRNLFGGPYAVSLYNLFLQMSFYERQVWYIDDGHLCVNTPEKTLRIPDRNQQGGFKAWINEVRPKGLPPIGGGSSELGCSSEILEQRALCTQMKYDAFAPTPPFKCDLLSLYMYIVQDFHR
ncbi:nacht nucleoside triphosphatase [Grosmannia clavigera kw1407]|uniref:Nacht nucleoside triphosphatase n=1 Tax=Grosmannia clavigera (strain kw1407 / UAMH 11150) TaxID=655863 RepID=F0X6P0_GROCL|nr:nacht nucleoside triphosphatase [Grosmannia clavigera kw1407]EFX06500.1 nacht nucleoside triphosphatase [Grosmannia clavigera kw1407]